MHTFWDRENEMSRMAVLYTSRLVFMSHMLVGLQNMVNVNLCRVQYTCLLVCVCMWNISLLLTSVFIKSCIIAFPENSLHMPWLPLFSFRVLGYSSFYLKSVYIGIFVRIFWLSSTPDIPSSFSVVNWMSWFVALGVHFVWWIQSKNYFLQGISASTIFLAFLVVQTGFGGKQSLKLWRQNSTKMKSISSINSDVNVLCWIEYRQP